MTQITSIIGNIILFSNLNVYYLIMFSNINHLQLKNSFPLPDELRPILFLSLYIYDQSCSFSLQNYDQTCSFSLQNYEQGVQHFQKFNFRCLFLLNKTSYQKSEKIEIPIFSPSFTPLNIVLE
jgi:hypothetical protein